MEYKAKVLVVDDEEQNRKIFSKLVNKVGHEAITAEDGQAALRLARIEQPDLIVLDINMPGMNGIDVLKELTKDKEISHIPVIVASGNTSSDDVITAIELGAEDYLPKPVKAPLLAARIRASLRKKMLSDLKTRHNEELMDRVNEQVNEISSGHIATIFAMSKLAESRDPETGEHLERMREYCKVLAMALMREKQFSNQIDEEYVERIFAASPLHDIGKVGIPDMILLKPGRLDTDERVVMETHSSIGAYTLREVHKKFPRNRFINMGIEIAESHHEKWDGSGYPLGLKGEEIPLCARILALADVYDALRSKRVYKPAFSHGKTHDILIESRGTHFDPEIMDIYIANAEQFDEIVRTHEDTEKLDLIEEFKE